MIGRRALRAGVTGLAMFGVVAGAFVGVGNTAEARAADDVGSRFTLAVLPDTQFYSRYAQSNFEPDYGTNPYAEQTAWIAEHAQELNIPFVTHVGDVVDQVGVDEQWQVADAAMRTLEDGEVPYSILPGNHDVLDSTDTRYDDQYDLAAEPYLKWFTPERAEGQRTDGGVDATGLNQYQIFEAEGQRFMVLALSWRASDATLDWANEVIDQNPEVPVILTSHDILAASADGTARTSPHGERLWDGLIADNDQIFLTFNGHSHGAAKTERTNNAGHTVTQVLIDYQMAYEGGNGYMGVYEFDLTNGRIEAETVSPWIVQKPTDKLTSYDTPVLDGPAQSFTIDIDFAERFAGFAPDFGPGDGRLPSLSDRAVEIITDGFEGVPASENVEPGSADDFVETEGTLAHWRMTGEPGTVDEGAVIEDVAGDNDLHRVGIEESGSGTAQPEDVSLVEDTYPFSSSGQSVCFANADKRDNRLSYLSTGADADVNDADLSGGYTVETFVKMDPSWDVDANSWSKAVVRSGNRSQIDGMPWSQWDYTASPVALGVSNLREFQWTEVGQDATKGDKTNWSGEIMVDTWSHVAVVNDPETAETTMYVDGAPVLRTAQDTIGQSFNEGMPWIIGSDWVDDAAANGWNGCVGETRIVDRPLAQDEWLTARPDLSGFEVTEAPETAAASADEVVVTGKGAQRASVTAVETEGSAVVAEAKASGTAMADGGLETVVGDDGTWALAIPVDSLSVDGTTLSLTQGFGERLSEPELITIALAEEDQQGPDAGGSGPGNEGEPEEPTGDAPAADEGSGDLATTGGSPSFWLAVLGALLAVAGGAFLVARKRMAVARRG